MTYCESCEADRLWDEEGIQPVWASPTHTCTVHACPPAGSATMPCCGRTPFEVALSERMSADPSAVTCSRRDPDCPECGDINCRCGIDWTADTSSTDPDHTDV